MHPKLAARQWGVLKQRQKRACDTIYALLLAIDGVSGRTFTDRARALDRVRDAAKALAAIDSLSPEALKSSARVTLKLSQALKFIVRMGIMREGGASGPPATERRERIGVRVDS